MLGRIRSLLRLRMPVLCFLCRGFGGVREVGMRSLFVFGWHFRIWGGWGSGHICNGVFSFFVKAF